jgi:hypothetical protein
MKTKAVTLMAWHYTTAERFHSIKGMGLILPATAGVPVNERPVCWFSVHQHFEPTAAKELIDPVTGKRRTATITDMVNRAGGLVRLGRPARELLTGEALRRKAQISGSAWTGLCRAAAQCGANPNQWFGAVGQVDLAQCAIKHFDPKTSVWQASTQVKGAAR